MATFIARSTNDKLRVVEDDGGSPSREMIRLYNQGWTLYRISSAGGGAFTLTPQRIATGTAVTEVVTVDFTLEDDV